MRLKRGMGLFCSSAFPTEDSTVEEKERLLVPYRRQCRAYNGGIE